MIRIKRGEAGQLADNLMRAMSDAELSDRTATITKISRAIDERWPGRLYRESRRAIAARRLTAEIKRRKKS